jgi:EAL and modified HD-GYP domain-containing signal transduction protein
MPGTATLGQIALGYSPIINAQRAVAATRLTVFPLRPEIEPDGAALLRLIDSVWPAVALAEASRATAMRPHPQVSLNIASEGLLHSVMRAAPGSHLMLEVPAFMAGDTAHAEALQRLFMSGTALALKGRPVTPLPPEVLACFSQCILSAGEDRRDLMPSVAAGRTVSSVQAGVHDSATMEAAFKRGNVAAIGWPWEDALPAAGNKSSVPSDIGAVMELINGVDREEPVAKLEAVLRRDPTLAFRLMRYLNSPAFGLPVEVNSFGHALMLLGYQRLKRWLALLLVSSSKAPNSQVLVYAAVRRGLLMEELGREHADSETRGEMFICGVFSLLPRLLQQPMSELLKSVPVPERVHQALRGDGGPFGAHLELLQAIEAESMFDIREKSEVLLIGAADLNRALLAALKAARDLQP